MHTRSDGKLFNMSRLIAKTKVREVAIRELLFEDDAAMATHSAADLQSRFSELCHSVGLTITLKKTEVIGQGVQDPPAIILKTYTLETVYEFTYLRSTSTDNLSLNAKIKRGPLRH